MHSGGICILEGKIIHAGIVTVLSVKCIKCESKFRIESSKRIRTADGHQRWVVNVAAVSSLTCTMAPMNVPGMPKRLYATTERFVSDSVKQLLTEKLITASIEERDVAFERGDFHQGVPAVTVS